MHGRVAAQSPSFDDRFRPQSRQSQYRRSHPGADRQLREEHLLVLAQALALAMFDSVAQRILECDAKTEALLVPLERHDVELAGPDKKRQKKTPRFDARAALARWAGVDLTRINGLSVATVMTIPAGIGPDLSRFASVKHPTLRQPCKAGTENGSDEPVARRLGARCVLPPAMRPYALPEKLHLAFSQVNEWLLL
ncbi:hypothetical protein OKW29_000106 [Paraburkholderia sp. CI3]